MPNKEAKMKKRAKRLLVKSIKQMKTLANGIDEYHIINPTSQTVFKLADIVTIIKDMEIPELIGERQD